MTIHGCSSFQQDGAPCHKVKAVKEWLVQNSINLISPWLGNSPDLNVIENCWVVLKHKEPERNPTSLASLKEAIKDVWIKEITIEYCEKLVMSMPVRIASVLTNKGQHTKY